jgi:5-methyltetrahydrofolate--homocysteine methyltransferase
MVGGAPLTDQYAKEIGADGYAPDAASAADTFKAFLA